MATTTPNYGWDVPTSTDYVKDGATAIETLGDDIDASLFSITGGKNVGLVHLATSTFTSASTVNINDVFNATYKAYKVKIQLPAVSGAPTIRLRVGGSDNTSAVYSYTHLYSDSGASYGIATQAANQTSITTRLGVYDFMVQNPFISEITQMIGTYINAYGTINTAGTFGANHNSTTSFTGFSLLGSGMTGTIAVYGIKE